MKKCIYSNCKASSKDWSKENLSCKYVERIFNVKKKPSIILLNDVLFISLHTQISLTCNYELTWIDQFIPFL